jgi:hypothetical protein
MIEDFADNDTSKPLQTDLERWPEVKKGGFWQEFLGEEEEQEQKIRTCRRDAPVIDSGGSLPRID